RGEVKTLRSAEAVSLALPLSGITLYSGLYINELLSRVLEYETRFSELFFDYLHCIQSLAGVTGTPEPALRRAALAEQGAVGQPIAVPLEVRGTRQATPDTGDLHAAGDIPGMAEAQALGDEAGRPHGIDGK
ncbi:DNA repair protein RecO C-terminal domain-containing protein, partial [Enterobacter hormaechei]|uniref:DNA repair protein RecO C-terminal domain-containing protein n=1 Tax=Enterobacter hormaechei TaxID=158836 RepID=UPI0020325889